ncbi:unnamed protein product [Phytophthora lilii]|uniref:Unnamed protein product n=1 Tax=Phytophthora lilii TaxID=2077276 RepID=A0A9W6TEW6_9STRA|nr:unnamed protein product [Phytophthora lilii]
MAELRAEIETLRASRQDRPTKAAETKSRFPSSMPKFKGNRGEDVRQWLFQVETLCRIHDHDASDDNATLPAIAGTAMEDPASGWFLFWASRTPAEEQTWAQFTHDALAHFEASNYQAVLRQKLRQLRQVDDIEDYNGKTCVLLLQETWSFQARLQEAEERSGKRPTTPVEEGPDVVRASEEDLTVSKATSNLLCEDPLVYSCTPLLSIDGDLVQRENKFKTKFLLYCGATTVYVSRSFVNKQGLKTQVYKERTIRVKLGDNKIGEALLELAKIEIKLKGVPNYQCVAVVFNLPDEFDCVLGMPFFMDVQPNVDWKRRSSKDDEFSGASTVDTSTPCGKCSQPNGSGLHGAVDSESSSTRSLDSCRAAVPETQPDCEVKTAERPAGDVNNLSRREKKNAQAEAMFTLGVVDSEGVETKYITRKKLRTFLRLPAKDQPEHDFMIVLTNDTIRRLSVTLSEMMSPITLDQRRPSDSCKRIGIRSRTTQHSQFSRNTGYLVQASTTGRITHGA